MIAKGSISITDNKIIVALLKPEDSQASNAEIIAEISEKGYDILYISINQPAQYLKYSFDKKGIDTSKIMFIDTVTRYALGKKPEEEPGFTYVNNPGDLTAIGIALTETLKKYNGNKLLVYLDSINAMLIHLPSHNVSKFIHFLTTKLRVMEIPGVYLAVDPGLDPILLSQLTAFADELIMG